MKNGRTAGWCEMPWRWLPMLGCALGMALAVLPEARADEVFTVRPYLQNPGANGITLVWFSREGNAGTVSVRPVSGSGTALDLRSSPAPAPALGYHAAERSLLAPGTAETLPFHHQVRLKGLEPGGSYRYTVSQGGQTASGSFQTPGPADKALRFIVYADSETEPESTGKHAPWSGGGNGAGTRTYLVDQTTGYAENLKVMRGRHPDFVAIAGDLVQSGGEQRDWDEFWRQNAALAASTVLLPALGNHDYFGGPGALGRYGSADSERAVSKYRTYFDLPDNGSGSHAERYYSLRYGPATLIVLDANDGLPHRSDSDPNWRLRGAGVGGFAPDWHAGSAQYAWLQQALSQAQRESRFTFVMFHGTPYSSGVHGRLPGAGRHEDILSGRPLRALTPLLLRYGVDAVFSGHDEMYEHSVVAGIEELPGGGTSRHALHFFDIGIGGDGLRGPATDVENPWRVFLAHTDAPEVRDEDGILIAGGKHYGHLEVNVEKNRQGQWQARIDPVYVLPLLDQDGRLLEFQRRLYPDTTILAEDRCPADKLPAAAPAP